MDAVGVDGEVVRHTALVVDAAEEAEVLAEVDLAVGAHLAGPAGQSGLHDDPVPNRHALSVAAELADHADDLVA